MEREEQGAEHWQARRKEELFDDGQRLAETVGEETGLRLMRENERAENQRVDQRSGTANPAGVGFREMLRGSWRSR